MASSDAGKGLDKPLKKVSTLDHLRSKKKPRFADVTLLMDPAVGDLVDAATKELSLAERSVALVKQGPVPKDLEDKLKAAKKAQEEALAAQEEASETFVFRSVGRQALDELISSHPPTNKQREEARLEGNTDLMYNPETFPQALVAAASYEPVFTLEEVQEIWDDPDWTTQELLALFQAANEANQYIRTIEPKKGSGRTRN